MKTLKDYIEEELLIINERLCYYTEYGYAPCLEPVVDALLNCKRELEILLKNS